MTNMTNGQDQAPAADSARLVANEINAALADFAEVTTGLRQLAGPAMAAPFEDVYNMLHARTQRFYALAERLVAEAEHNNVQANVIRQALGACRLDLDCAAADNSASIAAADQRTRLRTTQMQTAFEDLIDGWVKSGVVKPSTARAGVGRALTAFEAAGGA